MRGHVGHTQIGPAHFIKPRSSLCRDTYLFARALLVCVQSSLIKKSRENEAGPNSNLCFSYKIWISWSIYSENLGKVNKWNKKRIRKALRGCARIFPIVAVKKIILFWVPNFVSVKSSGFLDSWIWWFFFPLKKCDIFSVSGSI